MNSKNQSSAISPRQAAEDERAKKILVFRPEDAVFFNCLHPAGALFEVPVSQLNAARQHLEYQKRLEQLGIEVFNVADVLAGGCEDAGTHQQLIDFAASCLTYVPEDGVQNAYTSAEYKQSVLRALDPVELVKIIFQNPEVRLKLDPRNTGVETTSISIRPVGNTVFTRDQQITTQKGVVMCKFAATQRQLESRILEFTLNKMGITPIGHVSEAGQATSEGGDFVILTPDTAAIGVGLRSSYSAAVYLMQNNLLGFKRFLVVKDVFDQNQDRMHLDCVFAPLHRRLVVVDDEIFKAEKKRYVDEYVLLDKYDPELKSWYKLNRANVEMADYLQSEGYTVIRLPHEYQLAYGCNMLHLGFIQGKYRVFTVHEASKTFIEQSADFKKYCADNGCDILLEYVPFRSITSMYGSLHCASQVLERSSFDSDAISREHDVIAEAKETDFDYFVVVPTFCGRPELVHQVYEKYTELQKQGKKVLLVSKYWVNDFVSVKTMDRRQPAQLLLSRAATGQAMEHKAIELDDCVLQLK